MKNFKNRFIVMSLGMVLAAVVLAGIPQMRAQAALSHVKATAADVRTSKDVSAGALKGVQGTDFAKSEYNDSLQNLNMDAMFLNCDISWFVNTKGVGEKIYTMSDGTSYYFAGVEQCGMFWVVDSEIRKYREQGATWNLCLMMGWTDINGNHDAGMEKLMYNPQPGHYYYAWNVTDPEAYNALSAIVDYITEHFSYQDTFVQNWWINNEVNVLNDKIYSMDQLNAELLETLAFKSYDLLEASLKKNNPHALPYLSVTHDWNNTNEGKGVSTMEFLKAFAKAEQGKDWNVDLHAYPPQMHEQVWTKNSSAYLRHDTDTVSVCGANLEVFVNFIKENYGTNHRIIMSEQGFDSKWGQEEQAAMMAYTYLAAARSDMVDEVIFTTYMDTNSAGHDFYDMGIVDISGNKKPSYDVFRFMNTDQADAYLNPYLEKLSQYTGRPITSWADDILYQVPKTTDTLEKANLYVPAKEQQEGSIMIGMSTEPRNTEIDIEYRWKVYDYAKAETIEVQGWKLNGEWLRYYVPHNGKFDLICTARVAGNHDSQIQCLLTVNYQGKITEDISSEYVIAGAPVDEETRLYGSVFATWDGYTFRKDVDRNVRCFDASNRLVINEFKCDGTYTYFFQADGTAMKDRLSYHPDGDPKHVIYFDADGHEVFSNFANVKRTIAGDSVDDYCFFDVYGYLYVDVVTYDQEGIKLYYANEYGVMNRGQWFRFSDSAKWADGKPFDKNGGEYGYATEDGSLMVNAPTYDWEGRLCYLQGNGVAVY